MTTKELKAVLDDMYGFDISTESRKECYAYARKVFIKLARDYGFGWVDMKAIIGQKHDLCIYHYSTFHVINPMDLEKYNAAIDYFELPMEKIPSMSWFINSAAVNRMMKKLTKLSSKDIKYFKKYRVDRFLDELKQERSLKKAHNV